MMKEISDAMMKDVCGAGRNGRDSGSPASNRNKGKAGTGKGAYSGVDNCGKAVLGGLVAGSLGGPLGMGLGVAGGAIAGDCAQSLRGSDHNGSGNSGKNKSSGPNFGGQCTW